MGKNYISKVFQCSVSWPQEIFQNSIGMQINLWQTFLLFLILAVISCFNTAFCVWENVKKKTRNKTNVTALVLQENCMDSRMMGVFNQGWKKTRVFFSKKPNPLPGFIGFYGFFGYFGFFEKKNQKVLYGDSKIIIM